MIKQPRFGGLAAAPVILGALAALSLSACAASPAATSGPVTHLCQPQEVVGFSCEMRDHRLLSMCASSGFDKFQGDPKENPGYAYLTIGTADGQAQQRFPAQLKDYRQHMSTGVTLAGAPYLTVATEMGTFFYVNGRSDIPVSANPKNQPAGWSLPANGDDSLCTSPGQRENFDAVFFQIPKKTK